jgi:hypothetical protein
LLRWLANAKEAAGTRLFKEHGDTVYSIDILDNYQLPAIFIVSLIIICGASELGRLLGLRATGKGGQDVSTLEGAALGLLALMIGFTFAMALARFEDRRDAVLDEANKIQTTALRARMLPEPYAAEITKLLGEYVKIRLEFVQRLRSGANLKTNLTDLKATLAQMKYRRRFGRMRWRRLQKTLG